MKTSISMLILATTLLSSVSSADMKNEKITLKPNMSIIYNQNVKSVDNLSDFFAQGEVYGRLRANSFFWGWGNNTSIGKKDTESLGLGASFIFKSAKFSGWSTTLGLYTAQNPAWMREDSADVGDVKSGKDTFSRYKVAKGDGFGMTLFAQAYLEYDFDYTSVKLGRQMIESVFSASNDTKMIPNTFDGLTVVNKDFEKTTLRVAYLVKHKLRDHTSSHDVIAYTGGTTADKWSNNDDAGVNKNLTVDKIGDDNKLIIATLESKYIKNVKMNANYFYIPSVLSNLTLESHYTFNPSKNWKIIPGVRYMQQYDHLDADYNLANLATKHDGYKNSAKQSLDTNLLATRVDVRRGAFLARLGYSKIADKADIVTPWRGFPTGGFTRAMAQYNWNANTKSYMFQTAYDFDKAGVVDGLHVSLRYALQDFDDKKAGVASDSSVIHLDIMQNLRDDLQFKFRMGIVDAKDDTKDINGDLKKDWSYNEYRFEVNYFF